MNTDVDPARPTMTDPGRPAELLMLDESTCHALLGVHHVGRLIIPGDDPYVIPVNYTAVDGGIVFRTERRPVIEGILDQPVVFEVDMFDDRSGSGWSVVLRGDARELTAESDLDSTTAPGSVAPSWAPGEKSCVIRVDAARVTGRLLRGEVPPSPLTAGGYL